jgi:Uma2 family endonuclease
MSAAPKSPFGTDYAGLRMTAEEYFAIGETGQRYELIDGVVFMSPAPTTRHQRIRDLLSAQIIAIEETMPGLISVSEADLRLTRGKVYQPDLLAYRPGRLRELPERLVEPPDLIVEILSEGTKSLDLITKRDDYEAFGVREYWVVDQDTVTARVWRRSGEKLVEAQMESGVMESSAIAGLKVSLTRVRGMIGVMRGE